MTLYDRKSKARSRNFESISSTYLTALRTYRYSGGKLPLENEVGQDERDGAIHEWIRVVLTQFSAYMHWFIKGGVHVHVTILVDADVLR
jgi:hypothetical protein